MNFDRARAPAEPTRHPMSLSPPDDAFTQAQTHDIKLFQDPARAIMVDQSVARTMRKYVSPTVQPTRHSSECRALQRPRFATGACPDQHCRGQYCWWWW
jgi:hypothetical protein